MIRNWCSAALVACFVLVISTPANTAEGDTSSAQEEKDSSWASPDDSSSTLYKFEKKNENYLLQMKGTATDRKYTGADTGTVGLEALFGHLFVPSSDVYLGYYFFSGKIRTDSSQRFNATMGYFPPLIGGEVKLTYRLLHSGVKQVLPITGEFDKNAVEQGIAVYYKKYSNILLREFGLNYAYTNMGGESDIIGPYNVDTPTTWGQDKAVRGFGDTETHNALIELAFGSDSLDLPLVEGLRLDLGGGYQRATYGQFYDISETTDDGLTGSAKVQLCTPFGVLIGSYEDSPSADINSGGYKLGGLEAFYKKIDYERSDTQEVFGLILTFDIFNPGSIFDTSCSPLFHPSTSGYSGTGEMSHIAALSSDQFTTQKVNEIIHNLYQVNKNQMPDNVRIDTTGEPKLVVTTNCPQVNVRTVDPVSASSAFSLNGNEIYIGLAGLPTDGQTVVATVNDRCCGDTRVTLATRSGSLAVDSVDVREGVGCVPLLSDGSTCTVDSQCQSGICGSSGTCGGDTRDTCTIDSQCKVRVCGSSGTCGGDTRDACTIDNQCKVRVCGSSGTCGGDLFDSCAFDSECKVARCGSSETCGGDLYDSCTANSECKSSFCTLISPGSPSVCM